jgi:hypothetical protein
MCQIIAISKLVQSVCRHNTLRCFSTVFSFVCIKCDLRTCNGWFEITPLSCFCFKLEEDSIGISRNDQKRFLWKWHKKAGIRRISSFLTLWNLIEIYERSCILSTGTQKSVERVRKIIIEKRLLKFRGCRQVSPLIWKSFVIYKNRYFGGSQGNSTSVVHETTEEPGFAVLSMESQYVPYLNKSMFQVENWGHFGDLY